MKDLRTGNNVKETRRRVAVSSGKRTQALVSNTEFQCEGWSSSGDGEEEGGRHSPELCAGYGEAESCTCIPCTKSASPRPLRGPTANHDVTPGYGQAFYWLKVGDNDGDTL